MKSILDFEVFRDAKGRRCIAYNCNEPHCLTIRNDGSQVFVLGTGDTNSARIDAGQRKVRTMAAPHDRNPGGSGVLPALIPVWFQGKVLITPTAERMDRWWFLFAQIQRVLDPGAAGSSPPVALQIENVGGVEFFRAVVSTLEHPGGVKLDTPRVIVPRGRPFTFRIEYLDAKGGLDGRVQITVTVAGKSPQTVCDYTGTTGFDDRGGIYPAWGIYGADGWKPKQLPLVFRFSALDWGLQDASAPP